MLVWLEMYLKSLVVNQKTSMSKFTVSTMLADILASKFLGSVNLWDCMALEELSLFLTKTHW